MMPENNEALELVGLRLIVTGDEVGMVDYDLGVIADAALRALQIGILAMEQVVTGEKLVHSLHVGDFFAAIDTAIAAENGQGILSEPGSMSCLVDEIEGLLDIISKARIAEKAASVAAEGQV